MVIEGPFTDLLPLVNLLRGLTWNCCMILVGKSEKEFKVEGYGYPLEAAIERCRHYAVRKSSEKMKL